MASYGVAFTPTGPRSRGRTMLASKGHDHDAEKTPVALMIASARSGNLEEIKRLVGEDGGRERLNERDKKDRTPLHHAAQAGQFDIVKYMVENDANINARGENKRQPIHYAVMTKQGKHGGKQDASVLLYLMSQGVDVNARDALGLTTLHIAVMRGNKTAVFNLLSAEKININAKDKNGMTPLHLACLHGNEDIAQMLIGSGAKVQMKDRLSSTPLHAAAQGGHIGIVRQLLNAYQSEGVLKEMLTSGDSQDWTPLHLLVAGGHTSIVDLLLKYDKKLDLLILDGPNMDTPLHTASAAGHLPITRLLVERGAQLDSTNWNTATPLHHACANDHAQVAKYLLEKGADISARDELNFTPLLAAADGGHIDTLRVLLEEGAEMGNLGMMELFKWTVQEKKPDVLKLLLLQGSVVHSVVTPDEIAGLILPAAQNGSFGIVSELIRWKKETINRKDEEGNTPLHLAAALGHDLTVQELVKAKASAQARNSLGQMPLHLAAANGWSRTAEVLLKAKSSVNADDGQGCTPLHLAAMNGKVNMLKLLFSRGADITIRDLDNLNCLDHAIKQEHETTAMTILNHDQWWKALCSVSDNYNTPMRELIRKMPGVAKKVLDNCVTIGDIKSKGHEEIEFNYELIDDAFAEWMHKTSVDVPDSARPKQRAFEDDGVLKQDAVPYTRNSNTLMFNHPLVIMVSSQREELLAHPLVSSLLNHKWVTIGRWLYLISLTIYMFFLTALTGYIIVTPPR